MDAVKVRHCLALLFLGLVGVPEAAAGSGDGSRSCRFPAIYNFGDSNSDTGGISAAISEIHSPNGETFFGHPSGRACDGRLIIDFLAEKLKLPYLSAYLDSLGSNFRHGANFATGGSSIRPGGYSPFHLGIQISQFLQFKRRSSTLYNQITSINGSTYPPIKSRIPKPRDFSSALYTFDIGQNDLAYGFQHSTEEQVRASIPDILSEFSQALRQLYSEGARIFWVHNTGPIGCLPYSVLYNRNPHDRDANGCVKSQNDLAREFNRQLKNLLLELRKKLPLAAITHVDVYSVKYLLISRAKTEGFVSPMEFCCGSFYGYHINCGKREVVNGTVYGNACKDPYKHLSWDGIHYSEAANLWISNHILNGSFSEPPLPIHKACLASQNA